MKAPHLKFWSGLCLALSIPASAAVNFFNPAAGAPPLLSGVGLYTNIGTKTIDTAMKFFEVNAALWTDGTAKKRWIVLPPGTQITYVDSTDNFDYPNLTIVSKNFYFDTISTDTNSRIYWETRLLVNKEDAQGNDFWYGFSYRWNATGTDARLVGEDNADTSLNIYPKGLGGGLSYRKWTFPGSETCRVCHRVGTLNEGGHKTNARSVLGFMPAQLKRPSAATPGIDQIDELFNVGVFKGTRPTSAQKANRWKGVYENIPSGPADLRFRVIDTMARSYLGANCSGCHGGTNINVAGAAPSHLNFDFFQLKPAIEFGATTVGSLGIDERSGDSSLLSDGRHKYFVSVIRAGLSTAPGAPWDLSLPATGGLETRLVSAGYPALSMFLYRQVAARRPPWRDSLALVERLKDSDPANWKSWIFVKPWGSQAWRNDLASHNVKIEQTLDFNGDGATMPPLGAAIPDTAALKVLGEWVKNYRTLVRVPGSDSIVNLNGRMIRIPAEQARIQNRQLIVPQGWSGKATMYGVSGRVWTLNSAGKGHYAIPLSVPSGLYFFKVGNHTFRASVLR